MKAEKKRPTLQQYNEANTSYERTKIVSDLFDYVDKLESHLTTPDSLPTDREAGDYYDKISNKRVYHDLSLKDTFGQGFWACFGWLRSIQQLSPNSGGRDDTDAITVIKKALSISELWTLGNDVAVEHKDEAIVLQQMKYDFEQVINLSTQTPPPDEGECDCQEHINNSGKNKYLANCPNCNKALY